MDKSVIIYLITFSSGVITSLIAMYVWLYRKRKIKERIDTLNWEKEHITKIRKSSIEFNRNAFQSILLILFLISSAESVKKISVLFENKFILLMSQQFSFCLWFSAATMSFVDIRQFISVKKYKEAMRKIDKKIEKLESKLKE